MLISLGHKAKDVGVVGVFRTGKAGAVRVRYQLVEMTEDFVTPKGKEANQPIVKLMEAYTKELRTRITGPISADTHPNQATAKEDADLVGRTLYRLPQSRRGMGEDPAQPCVQDAGERNPALESPVRPGVHRLSHGGLGYTGASAAEKTPKLLNVGCESCHGPAACTSTTRTTWRCPL